MTEGFIFAALLLLLTPGPTNTLLGAFGAALGWRRAAVLPLAEALGYGIAISVFHAAGGMLAGSHLAMAALKTVAGLWLFYSGVRLWSEPVVPSLPQAGAAFRRVLMTTVLNPKALFVAAVIMPGLWTGSFAGALAVFLVLAVLAGLGWTALGAALPPSFRGYSYKAASVVILGFSLTALASLFAA